MNKEIVNALRTIDSIERKLNKDSEIKTKDINNKLFDGIIKEYKEKCENVIRKYKNKEINDKMKSFIKWAGGKKTTFTWNKKKIAKEI